MACRGIDRLCHARGRPVTPAVVRRTKKRAALHHPARYGNVGHVGVIALVSFSTLGIETRATGMNSFAVLLVPVRRPFPNIAGHVVQPVTVGRKAAHRRRSFETIEFKILPWEFPLPGVRHLLLAGSKFIPPNELRTIQSAARGEFP